MKSNVCTFKRNATNLANILEETNKIAQYNNLGKKESLRLRLLAEEMVGLLNELVKKFDGEFYVENEGNKYELHSVINIPTMTSEIRKDLIEFSSSKSNSASKGILGKIRNAFDVMLLNFFENGNIYVPANSDAYDHNTYYEWDLVNYVENNESKDEIKEELQKSIIGNIADNVVVSIKGGKVNIVIAKAF